MSSVLTRTEQKLKEWFGSTKITKDSGVESRKDRVNEVDQYMRGLSQCFSSLSALYQQLNSIFGQMSQITLKLYEKEVDTNKRIGMEVSSIFGNISELYRSKVQTMAEINTGFAEWFQTIETLKIQMKSYQEVRVVYDHYKEKVEKLEKQNQLSIQKGSMDQYKLTEKLRRNSSKFQNAEVSFKGKMSEILNNMNKILGIYFKMTNTAIETFIGIHYDVTSNTKSIVKKNLKVYSKFKYPEMEAPVDLVQQQKDSILQAQMAIEKLAMEKLTAEKAELEKQLAKEKEDKLADKSAADKVTDKPDAQKQQDSQIRQSDNQRQQQDPQQWRQSQSQIQQQQPMPNNRYQNPEDFLDDVLQQQMNDMSQRGMYRSQYNQYPPQQQYQQQQQFQTYQAPQPPNPFEDFASTKPRMSYQQPQYQQQPPFPFDMPQQRIQSQIIPPQSQYIQQQQFNPFDDPNQRAARLSNPHTYMQQYEQQYPRQNNNPFQ